MESLRDKSSPGLSLRKAINAKCRDCIYDPQGVGNWRQQVTGCSSPACPLFLVRPLSKGAKTTPQIETAGNAA